MEDNKINSKKQQHTTTIAPKTQPTGTAENRPNLYKNDKKIWTTFNYHSPKIRTIANLFKNTNVNIAFRTTTTTQQYIKQKKITPFQKTKNSEYTKSHAIHPTRHISGKQAIVSRQDTRIIHDTLRTMTQDPDTHCIYSTTGMNISRLLTQFHF